MSEKITCDVIRDLMILCEDDVCSEDSKRLIEQHISECSECRNIYEMTNTMMPEMKLFQDETKELIEIQAIKSFRKIKKKITIETMLLIFVVILTFIFGEYIWIEHVKEWVHAVPSSQIEVTELYQLKNGDIYCTLKCDGYFSWKNIEVLQTPDDKQLEDCNQAWYEVHFQTKFLGDEETEMMKDSITLIFPKEGNPYNDEIYRKCAAIKYVGANKEDVLMIWEDSQSIESAPRKIVDSLKKKKYRKEFGYSYGYPIIIE